MAYFTVMTPSELLLSPAVAMVRRREPPPPPPPPLLNSIQMNSTRQTALLLLLWGLRRHSETESFILCRGSFRSLLPFLHSVRQMEAASPLAGMKRAHVPAETGSFLLCSVLRAQRRQMRCLKWRTPPTPPPQHHFSLCTSLSEYPTWPAERATWCRSSPSLV